MACERDKWHGSVVFARFQTSPLGTSKVWFPHWEPARWLDGSMARWPRDEWSTTFTSRLFFARQMFQFQTNKCNSICGTNANIMLCDSLGLLKLSYFRIGRRYVRVSFARFRTGRFYMEAIDYELKTGFYLLFLTGAPSKNLNWLKN